jgi:drug/metabolite transporter (DMT)-like permease
VRAAAGRGLADLPSHRPAVALEAAAGALAIAFSAILFRLAHVSPSTGAFFRCLYAVPALVLVARFERRRGGPRAAPGRRERVLGAIAGLWLAADLILWNHSIDAIGAGLATVLSNTQVVMVALAAWAIWGERPSRRTMLAGVGVLAGVVLISGVVGSAAYGARPLAGVIFGGLTGVAYTAYILLLRQSGRDGRPAGALSDATASCAVACAVAGLALGDLDLTPGWRATGWLVVLALGSQVVGWLLISASLTRLPAALTAITLTLQPVASVVFGAIILGESPSSWQIVGVAVILAAVLAASTGRRVTAAVAAAPAAPASPAIPARPRLGGRTGPPSSR